MKLNYKRTILVGFAFFLICAFWQAYDNIIPKILVDKFGMSQGWSGFIMALDNILAVFLLPLFGSASDKCRSKLGRRTPFILIGTVSAAISFVCLSIPDSMQLEMLSETGLDSGSDAVWALTMAKPAALIFFIVMLLVVLLSMSLFRSPAVALMPDVTPKPLRSKANAVINLMGSFGGILVLGLGIVFGTGKPENRLMKYTGFLAVVGLIMLLALAVFMIFVKEKAWAIEPDANDEKDAGTPAESHTLSRGEKTSLILILLSVVLWYMGYNAVTSKYSVYAGEVLKLDYNTTLIVAQAAAILSYIPVGIISSRIGRKKTILAGVVMLGTAFGCAAFLREGSNIWVMNGLFALAGIGWATINVNSFPMVVELARGGDVGKFTGYYYAASMAAQIATPVLSGILMDLTDMTTLFPYATVFVALAFITMLFVRHGDAVAPKKELLEHLDVDAD